MPMCCNCTLTFLFRKAEAHSHRLFPLPSRYFLWLCLFSHQEEQHLAHSCGSSILRRPYRGQDSPPYLYKHMYRGVSCSACRIYYIVSLNKRGWNRIATESCLLVFSFLQKGPCQLSCFFAGPYQGEA